MAQPRTIAAKLARQIKPPGGTVMKAPVVPSKPGSIRRPTSPLAPRFSMPPKKPLHKLVVPRPSTHFARWEEPPEPGQNPGSGRPTPIILRSLPHFASTTGVPVAKAPAPKTSAQALPTAARIPWVRK